MNSKNGNNYAHKQTWAILPYELTRKKPFDYYPRGRVEIRNGVCRIYLNPNLNKPKIIEYLKEQYELQGFEKLRIIEDRSSHYKSNLFKEGV